MDIEGLPDLLDACRRSHLLEGKAAGLVTLPEMDWAIPPLPWKVERLRPGAVGTQNDRQGQDDRQ
jgi:hypothetical protein